MPTTDYPITVRGRDLLGGSPFPDRELTVKLYDFRRPDKFSWEQIRTFSMMHEEIARLMAINLASVVGFPCEVSLREVDQMTYAECLELVPEHSPFAVLNVPPLRGPMIMQIDASLAGLLVASACGQRAARLVQQARRLTELELVILEAVVEELLPSLREGWRSICPIEPRIVAMERDPRMVMVVPPTEMIILASFEVSLGETSATIRIPVPSLTIEAILGRFSAFHWYRMARAPGTPRLGAQAEQLRVECEIALPAGSVSLARLASVLGGEPLPLPTLAEGEAELRAGSVAVARVGVRMDDLNARETNLPVLETRTPGGGGAIATAGATGTGAGRPSELIALTEEVRAMRQAVEELSDDRDALSAARASAEDQPAAALTRPADEREAREIALLLSNETGATIACYLAALEPVSAARLLAALSDGQREETVRSLADLAEVERRLANRVCGFIGRRLRTVREATLSGGPDIVAAVLNHVPRAVEKAVMEKLMATDKELFESIAQRVFVFEDFMLVDQSSIAKLAARVGADEWALALKGVPREIVSHILGAMGEDQVAAIHEAESVLGRTRRSDVESAQREIIEELRTLEERGEVVVARPDEVVE